MEDITKENEKSHPAQPTKMICPQCRHQQPIATECRKCGVIIGKAKARAQQPLLQSGDMPKRATSKPNVHSFKWQDLQNTCIQFSMRMKHWIDPRTQKRLKTARWFQRLADAFIRLAIVWGIALALEIGLLHLGNGMWYIYESTPVGQHYLAMPDSLGANFQYMTELNLVLLGFEVTLTALVVCLTVSTISHFLYIARFFFEPFGFLARLILWILPLTGTAGWLIHTEDAMITMSIACTISFLPILLLHNRSFNLALVLIPDLGTVISAVLSKIGGFNNLSGMLKKKYQTIKAGGHKR